MKVYCKRTLNGLAPISNTEFDKLQEAKLKLGQVYEVTITKPRNIKFHRKFFALISICFDNQDIYTNQEDLREQLIIAAGYYRIVNDLNNIPHKKAKSMSFAKMDEIEFNSLYSSVADVVCRFLSIDNETLAREVAERF